MLRKVLFMIGVIFVTTRWASPPIALGLGLSFGLIFANPFATQVHTLSQRLLQVCVVGLGFSMNLHEVVKVGRSGLLYTILGIGFVMTLGVSLARLLKITSNGGFLIAVGTAICGGSAIAAVGPVVDATDEEMSVSLGTVFILNSIALIAFPVVGRALGLTQEQFGLWAALAIHDTSSVVGAGIKYGAVALAVATTVKLARAMWIAPVALVVATRKGQSSEIKWPWFILFFVAAAVINTYLAPRLPIGPKVFSIASSLLRTGLILTLYLIGSNISRAMITKIGVRPLLHGTLLWLIVTMISLGLIYNRIIVL
jgi:uncharacterized integral membrane protein (TIGR00698 family)